MNQSADKKWGIIAAPGYRFILAAGLAWFAFAAVLLFFRPGGLLGKPLPIPGQ